ncbi:hypothetical protein ACJIZ3_020402 [Penstemon smallii]|uniref:BHLH domain-containing protein n=1 Tax=Penstemon smallii TaxID=265156 RepID=A0ABD3SJ51_9LAMI
MMAGNPNWWSINGMHPQLSSSSQFVYNGSSNPENPSPDEHPHQPNQDFPVRSWSQLLMGGLGNGGEEERFGASIFQQQKKLENWEDQVMMNNININMNMNTNTNTNPNSVNVDHVKQEVSQSTTSNVQLYHEFHHANNTTRPNSSNSWNNYSHHSNNSPTSCVTTNLSSNNNNNNNNNFLNFSATTKAATAQGNNNKSNHHNYQDRSSECNSTSTGGVSKKARVQQSSAQPALKVRKEKLGDRITALHQLVSPFGKTDTASVLSEAIGYIRFLQGQIEALSSPYMRNATGSTGHHQHSVQERNCLFPEEPGQFLNHDIGMDGRGAFKQDSSQGRGAKDLRSRGLCLVPLSCTQHVENDNGADYWAPAALGGGF